MNLRKLGELKKGMRGLIKRIDDSSSEFSRRLLEMGLIEGSTVEIVHEAPFGGDPIALRVRGSLVALRRNEANRIEVEV
ncbi:ferrous iron transport protein A [bacterium]|jgi:ferrous iron transport protein A|nr:ferrous iron transport protein A [bacterium]